MIDRQEIMDFAREFALAPNVVEKDYVFGWLLAGIAGRPFAAPRRTAKIKANWGPTHVIQCPYCQKKFNRSSYDTSLNPHKNQMGYPCAGRTGYLVETKY